MSPQINRKSDSVSLSGGVAPSDSRLQRPVPGSGFRSFGQSLVAWGSRHRRELVFPALVLSLLVVFTLLGVSGSSTPLLSPSGGGGDSVLIGSPRSIRSDEWIVHTPLVISQVENGAPRYGDVGVGSHDMSILSDTPVLDWTSVFHPNLWAYYFLPLNNAHAFDWWSVAAILLIGTYVFLLVLVRSLRWSILGAVFFYASPFFHWWYTSVIASIGWLLFSAACFLVAVKSSGAQRLVFLLATAFCFVCFALIIYPPMQIAAVIAVAAITLGALWSVWREQGASLRRIFNSLLLSGGAAMIPLIAFYLTRRPAFQAISQTVYPGARVIAGGELPWTQLFTGWFGLNYVTNGPALRGVLFPNESEASSFLFLGVALLIALPFVWRFVAPIGDRLRPIAIAAVAAMALFLTQAFVGLPTFVAKLTLLSAVPERRALVGLGVSSMVLTVVIGCSIDRLEVPKIPRILAGTALTLFLSAGTIGLALDFREVHAEVGTRLALLAVVAAVIPGVLFFWRPRIAVLFLVVVGLVVSLSVNPLIRGLSQTRSSILVEDVREIENAAGSGGAWIGETYWIASLLTTSGVRNLSGVNLYPNVPAWEILDPDHKYENAWNRYAQAVWSFDSTLAAPVIRLVQTDMVEVRMNPCDPALDRFSVHHIVSPRRLSGDCLLNPLPSVGPEGEPVFIYERIATGTAAADGWTIR